MIDKFLSEMKVKLIIKCQVNKLKKLSKKPKNFLIFIQMDCKILEEYQIRKNKKK